MSYSRRSAAAVLVHIRREIFSTPELLEGGTLIPDESAGGAEAYALVERPGMPKRNETQSGNSRDTDGRVLVLEMR